MRPRAVRAALVSAAAIALAIAAPAAASAAPSGAIFTTVANGSEVNFNQYPSKEAVYLDGGPGPGAPQTAAGLDDGTYVFQVTNPSGKVLLSQDAAVCRQFVVSGGIITALVPSPCQHQTGLDVDHGALTVQLMPYADTPNNGGVYKVWATPLASYLAGCAQHGFSDGLSVVDCGYEPGDVHGFIPGDSKTDNFKVKKSAIVEIDTVFFDDATHARLDGRYVDWTDPLGAGDRKWSYLNTALDVNHEAHVEAVETGTHVIDVPNQPGCSVEQVVYNGQTLQGPQTIAVPIKNDNKDLTVFIYVTCAS